MSEPDQRPIGPPATDRADIHDGGWRPRGDRPNSPYRIAALVLGIGALAWVVWFVLTAILDIFAP